MKNPIIIEGTGFDWKEGNECAKRAVEDDGSINWRAAFWADPGVMTCPKCAVYLWQEGLRVRCPDCSHEFDTRNKRSAP